MDTRDAYNSWAKTYDTITNKTRDLESIAIQKVLGDMEFDKVLEIGCGTGKNTQWLAERSNHLTAVDFSGEMLILAKQKINLPNVVFKQADLMQQWQLGKVNLVTCSLVLEHIENLDFIFEQASLALEKGGLFYICELHPYKQLEGSRAKFELGSELIQLDYFIHHASDYFQSAHQFNFVCEDLKEWFDEDNRNFPPRLISYIFKKN